MTMTDGAQMPVVVLDPGHGGATQAGGSSPNHAAGPGGLLEKEIALDLALRAARLLAPHAHVILTRSGDQNLSLAERAAVARSNRAASFLSIHFNGSHDPAVDGTEVWVARRASDQSVELARRVQDRLRTVTGAADRGVRRADLGVLLPERQAPETAACLVEVAFLSNPVEAGRLAGDGYRERLAEALAEALLAGSSAAAPVAHSQGIAAFLVDRLVRYFQNQDRSQVPLDPGSGGLSIAEDALQIGDIIVSTTAHASSDLIRFGTGSQVSHAALYIGGGQVVEAIGQGVVLRSLADALADDTVATAFRYPGITQEQQLRVRDYAGRQLGLPYNYLGIVRQAAFQVEASNCDALPSSLQAACRGWVGRVVLGPGNTDTFFCSQLVLAAYADAGIPLTATPPSWSSPQDIVEIALSARLGYVGHLKAPALSASSSLDTVTLGYGVPGGQITDGFYRDRAEKLAVTGRTAGRGQHLGIDVSTSNAHGGGADDPRRGLPVYAAVRRTIPLSELNSVRTASNGVSGSGVGLDGQGDAELSHAIVLAQPWGTQSDAAYGGVVGLACRYGYTKSDGSAGTFTLYLEYLHLITPSYPPKDGDGNQISADDWAATGKGSGFGPRIQNGARLSADDLTAGDPILVGHLGATQFPHTHLQAAFGPGEQRYLRTPRIDPALMLTPSLTTTQSLALSVSLALGGLTLKGGSVDYDVPGGLEPAAVPAAAGWAAAAALLASWRDGAERSPAAVCRAGGPLYEARLSAGAGLTSAEAAALAGQLGFVAEALPLDPGGWASLLRRFGPLWAQPPGGAPAVVTGIAGDGSAGGSSVWLIETGGLGRRHESFQHFLAALPSGGGHLEEVRVFHLPALPAQGVAPASAVSSVPG